MVCQSKEAWLKDQAVVNSLVDGIIRGFSPQDGIVKHNLMAFFHTFNLKDFGPGITKPLNYLGPEQDMSYVKRLATSAAGTQR
jgi:hypothetical protein